MEGASRWEEVVVSRVEKDEKKEIGVVEWVKGGYGGRRHRVTLGYHTWTDIRLPGEDNSVGLIFETTVNQQLLKETLWISPGPTIRAVDEIRSVVIRPSQEMEEGAADVSSNNFLPFMITFPDSSSFSSFISTTSPYVRSHLENTDTATRTNYFQYYGKLVNQMNMLQDEVRTAAYCKAITTNPSDFYNKVVMDVGAGSGILSFFAAQSGARTVYAVEASSMAEVIEELRIGSEAFSSVIKVVNSTVESVLEPLKVDVLVSEPIGTFLFNERMIESFLFARDRFLDPIHGKMFPNKAHLALAPFSDPALYADVSNRNVFWRSSDFYGVDLRPVAERAREEQLRQPIVGLSLPYSNILSFSLYRLY
eukprot:GHVS01013177.1.p1 GENE.GHVS01013177.1~~GHVS01013177.1.p1  ORF type:complete len:365 (+),score=63.48 GHVS01013177.1:227-1321(+)